MRVVAVVEQQAGAVRAALEKAVGTHALVVTPQQQPPPYDIVVWAQNPCPDQLMPLSARALAVSGDCVPQALAHCRCSMVLTYGFSSRDTLTPSATLGEDRVMSLQRGLVTLNGCTVEPMELRGTACADAETDMAVTAVRLLLGC